MADSSKRQAVDTPSATARFVEAIEYTLTHDILQFVRNRPQHLAIYYFHRHHPYAHLVGVLSMHEADLTDDQIKVRYVTGNEWHRRTPIFTSYVHAVEFLWEECHIDLSYRLCLGIKMTNALPDLHRVPSNYFTRSIMAASDWCILNHMDLYLEFYEGVFGNIVGAWHHVDMIHDFLMEEDMYEIFFVEQICIHVRGLWRIV